MKEYKVTVSMTEHAHDNAEAPYYWGFLVWENDAWSARVPDGGRRLMRYLQRHAHVLRNGRNKGKGDKVMGRFHIGDIIYFPVSGSPVNRGTVEAVEGPFIRVRSKVPGTEYVMEANAFHTREELMQSEAYEQAWAAGQAYGRMNRLFGTAMLF